MTTMQNDVVLLSFIKCLQEHGCWCGETHIQKGTYLFQEVLEVPLSFEFILYKHGPYSFDLKDGLTALMADGLLEVKPRPPYGPSLLLGENCQGLLQRFPRSSQQYHQQAEFVANRVASRDVRVLERLATAVFVTRKELPAGTIEERAAKLHELKPHVPLDLAHEAILEADKLIAEAASVGHPIS
jgi:uncharacterized protein YwgA